jgi:hypothetical protein
MALRAAARPDTARSAILSFFVSFRFLGDLCASLFLAGADQISTFAG